MYDYIKALHLIFVITWFAGLFYIVRLFIYHSETKEMDEPKASILQEQYKLMSRRLWYIITWPAMILTTVFGVWMLVENSWFLKQGFFHLKLGFVLVLYVYHFASHLIFRQLQRNEIRYSSTKLRIWNEIATLLLVAIVFLIVLQSSLKFVWGTVGFFLVGILLMLGIKLYKKIRGK